MPVAVCLTVLWISYLLTKWWFSSLLSGHVSPPHPQSSWLLNINWLANFEHVVQSLLQIVSFWCMFLDPPLTTYDSNIDSNIDVQIIAKLELGPSTLESWCHTIQCLLKRMSCWSILHGFMITMPWMGRVHGFYRTWTYKSVQYYSREILECLNGIYIARSEPHTLDC